MQCPQCKKSIGNTDKFCPHCGAQIASAKFSQPSGQMDYNQNSGSYDPYPGESFERTGPGMGGSNSAGTGYTDPEYENYFDDGPESEENIKKDSINGDTKMAGGDVINPEPESNDLRKKILILAAAVVLVAAIIVVLVILFHSGSDSETDSASDSVPASSVSEESELTEEEAQAIIENHFQCCAVKTDEIKDTLTFDCYGIWDRQAGTYDEKLGSVQINRTTGVINVIEWESDEDSTAETGEVIDPTDDDWAAITVETSPAPVAADTSAITSYKYVYNTDFGLYLWKDTKCSDHYCTVYLGDEVGFIENVSGTKYAKVSYGQYIGYINKNYLTDTPVDVDTTVKYSMYATSDGVKFRNGPSDSYTALYSLAKNSEVGYIGEMSDHPKYVKVSYGSTIGYVLKSQLSTEKENTTVDHNMYIANVDYGVFLYTSTSATKAYCTVLLGEQVGYIESASSSYAKVKYGSYYGYINKKYLSDTKPKINETVDHNMYVSGDNAALCAAPTTASTVYQYLSSGTEIGFIERCTYATTYAKVKYNGTIGYMLLSSLSETKPQTEKQQDNNQNNNQNSNQNSNQNNQSDQNNNQNSNQNNQSDQNNGQNNQQEQEQTQPDNQDSPSQDTPTEQTPSENTSGGSSSDDEIVYPGTLPSPGSGSAPSNYLIRTASVTSGALGLRNAKASNDGNIINWISNGATVWVVDNSEDDTFWYVYVPDLGMYGYVNSDYLK